MKFYYNGKLVRTSKNHIYTHAVLNENNKPVGCRASKDAAHSIITTELHRFERGIENMNREIKAIEQGKKMYRSHEGNRSYYLPVGTKEKALKHIEYCKKSMEYIKNNWKVVELETK